MRFHKMYVLRRYPNINQSWNNHLIWRDSCWISLFMSNENDQRHCRNKQNINKSIHENIWFLGHKWKKMVKTAKRQKREKCSTINNLQHTHKHTLSLTCRHIRKLTHTSQIYTSKTHTGKQTPWAHTHTQAVDRWCVLQISSDSSRSSVKWETKSLSRWIHSGGSLKQTFSHQSALALSPRQTAHGGKSYTHT